ncbi:hypothetical protein, partial [Prosthecochloris vibrioformis]
SGMRDEGRPLAIGLQEQVANHRKQHWSKALVVSVTEKVPYGIRYGSTKTNNRELPFNRRNRQNDIETGDLCCSGISLVETCLRIRRYPA